MLSNKEVQIQKEHKNVTVSVSFQETTLNPISRIFLQANKRRKHQGSRFRMVKMTIWIGYYKFLKGASPAKPNSLLAQTFLWSVTTSCSVATPIKASISGLQVRHKLALQDSLLIVIFTLVYQLKRRSSCLWRLWSKF